MPFNFEWQKPELPFQSNKHGQEIGLTLDDWRPSEKPIRQSLTGQYCRLEPFDSTLHGSDLFSAFSTEALNWTYLPYGPFEQRQDFIDWCAATCHTDDPFFYSVIDTANNNATGVASYLRITPDSGSLEVGHIHFSPLMQGTRLATEAMFLMMQHAFDKLGYRRYEWKCDALNAKSCAAAQRFGFQFEGIFRQATVYKQRSRDTAWFAVIDSDWPALKKGYQSWLAAENFKNEKQFRTLKQCIDAHK